MGLNHSGELLVGMQALPFEAVFPTCEKGASPAFGAVIPELPEGLLQNRVYADSCGLKTAFLGNSGRNAATIFSLRYSSSR